MASALRAKGYAVNTNIGSLEYRVYIGIINPKNPDTYLLCLLCDGYNYLASMKRGLEYGLSRGLIVHYTERQRLVLAED